MLLSPKSHVSHGHGDAERGWMQGASRCPGKSSLPGVAGLCYLVPTPPSCLFAQVDFALQQEEAQTQEIGRWCVPACCEPWSLLPGVVLVLLPLSVSVSFGCSFSSLRCQQKPW